MHWLRWKTALIILESKCDNHCYHYLRCYCYNICIIEILFSQNKCYNLISDERFALARLHGRPTTKTGVFRVKWESWNTWSLDSFPKTDFLIRMWLIPLGDSPKYIKWLQKNCLKASHLPLYSKIRGRGNLLSS